MHVGLSLQPPPQIVKSHSFTMSAAQSQLNKLHINQFNAINNTQSMKLHTLIDMSNEMLICSLGALVQYVYDNRVIDDSSDQININNIQSIPCSVLYIDNHTKQQLNIFHTVSHPDASNTNKEGTSLYQHLNQCKTNNGSKLLRYVYIIYLHHTSD